MATTATSTPQNPDALPQLIGEFKPADEWQTHITQIFYGLKADRIRDYYQTFATADYRLAHALATEYYDRAVRRDQAMGNRQGAMGDRPGNRLEAMGYRQENSPHSPAPIAHSPLVVHEWGCGNGNLAACFLSHLKKLDREGLVYPRVRYILVDSQPAVLEAALNHPDLVEHKAQVDRLCASVEDLATVKDGTVDRIVCNELWNELPTKLMLRKGGEIEEEYLRPNLSETAHAAIADWPGFIQAFEAKDLPRLKEYPFSLEDIVWEKEYRKADWQSVPYRKTISEFLKRIDEEVLVPVNLGAFAAMKEAKRVLAPDAVGFSSFDAGTADMVVLNDPEKPCYGQFGGQYSFMVNLALIEAVAAYQGIGKIIIEPQKEFVGRSLGTNVLSLMDLLATYPSAGTLASWEQDRLILKTMRLLNESYRSPYVRAIEFPLRNEMPPEERETLQGILLSLKRDGVPDTIAYLSEEEVFSVMRDLEALGYDQDHIRAAFRVPPQSVDYYHCFFRP